MKTTKTNPRDIERRKLRRLFLHMKRMTPTKRKAMVARANRVIEVNYRLP